MLQEQKEQPNDVIERSGGYHEDISVNVQAKKQRMQRRKSEAKFCMLEDRDLQLSLNS